MEVVHRKPDQMHTRKTRSVKSPRKRRVWFPNEKAELKGFRILLDSGIPTYATKDDRYIINELQYSLLKESKVEFKSE